MLLLFISANSSLFLKISAYCNLFEEVIIHDLNTAQKRKRQESKGTMKNQAETKKFINNIILN